MDVADRVDDRAPDAPCVAGRPWLVAVPHDPERDREQWIESRLDGIGGSDAAAVVGEHPNRSAIDVWQERVSLVIDDVDHERGDVGRLLESPILGWYSTGSPHWPRSGGPLRVAKPPTVYHRDRPWQRGSADGLVYMPETVAHLADGAELLAAPSVDHLVEIKSHGWFASRAYANLDARRRARASRSLSTLWVEDAGDVVHIPPDKRIQCAWYMALFGVDRCRLLALIDTHLRRTYEIERDQDLEDTLLEQVDRFWRSYVLTGEPPPPDGSESYRGYLAQRFSKHGAELVETTPEVDQAIRDHIECKRAASDLVLRTEHVEQVIKSHIGDTAGVRTDVGNVTWKSQRSGRLRVSDALSELYAAAGWLPDQIAAFEARHAQPDHRVLRTPNPKK